MIVQLVLGHLGVAELRHLASHEVAFALGIEMMAHLIRAKQRITFRARNRPVAAAGFVARHSSAGELGRASIVLALDRRKRAFSPMALQLAERDIIFLALVRTIAARAAAAKIADELGQRAVVCARPNALATFRTLSDGCHARLAERVRTLKKHRIRDYAEADTTLHRVAPGVGDRRLALIGPRHGAATAAARTDGRSGARS